MSRTKYISNYTSFVSLSTSYLRYRVFYSNICKNIFTPLLEVKIDNTQKQIFAHCTQSVELVNLNDVIG